MTGHTGYTR